MLDTTQLLQRQLANEKRLKLLENNCIRLGCGIKMKLFLKLVDSKLYNNKTEIA